MNRSVFGLDFAVSISSRRRKEIAHDLMVLAQQIGSDCGHDYQPVEFLIALANDLGYDPSIAPPAPYRVGVAA